MGDNAPDQNESEEKNIKESKGTKVCINQNYKQSIKLDYQL